MGKQFLIYPVLSYPIYILYILPYILPYPFFPSSGRRCLLSMSLFWRRLSHPAKPFRVADGTRREPKKSCMKDKERLFLESVFPKSVCPTKHLFGENLLAGCCIIQDLDDSISNKSTSINFAQLRPTRAAFLHGHGFSFLLQAVCLSHNKQGGHYQKELTVATPFFKSNMGFQVCFD